MRAWSLILLSVLLGACAPRTPDSSRVYNPNTKFPSFQGALARTAFAPLPLGSVKPRGWLLEQLRAQAEGLGGNIEDVWPDLGPKSAWRGGNGEAWERGPYYLDGLVPLAFLLDDAELKARMQKWMDWNLTQQHQDGSFGPARAEDWWPDMVFLKALLQYEEASGDERVGPFLEKYFAHLKQTLPSRRLDAWRKDARYDEQRKGVEDLVGPSNRWQYYRWTEMVLSLLWQYRRTASPELLKLAQDLKAQGYGWQRHFQDLPFKVKSRRDQVYLLGHGVNNAMGMKANALAWVIDPSASAGQSLQPLDSLNRWHGQANGTFGSDEQLAGLEPSQGTELCTVMEQAYSLETMLWISGDPRAGDALERLAFNALPATSSPDCWRHQYDQQVNQIEASEAPRAWSNNGPRANIFGLEPEWGCCTANFHQGWPKFAAHLWMASPDGGLALQSWAPSSVAITMPSGNTITVEVTGSYPYDGDMTVQLFVQRSESFPLHLRIPAWVKGASVKVGGQEQRPVAGRYLKLVREWKNEEVIQVRFVMAAKVEAWGQGSVVTRGPLLFALPIAAREHRHGSEKWSDEELFPIEAWNYAPQLKVGSEILAAQVESRPLLGKAFDPQNPPVKLKVPARLVSNWVRQENSAGPLPAQAKFEGEEKTVNLVPYASTRLRVSVFPRFP